MPAKRTSSLHLLIAAAVINLSVTTHAHNPAGGFDLTRAVAQSDLVAFARVVDVTHALSEGRAGVPPVPHTFVTFELLDTLLGQRQPRVTLRFLGGIDKGTGDVLFQPVFPGFDVGDRDFILVQGNTVSECPLVDCAAGRFRSYQGRVFTEKGRPVLRDAKGVLSFGPRQPLPPVDTQTFGDFVLGRSRAPDNVKDDGGEPLPPLRVEGEHLDERAFAQILRDAISRSGTASAVRPRVPSADPRVPFAFDAPQAATPADKSPPPPRMRGIANPAEEDALRRSGGNPVLNARTHPIDRRSKS